MPEQDDAFAKRKARRKTFTEEERLARKSVVPDFGTEKYLGERQAQVKADAKAKAMKEQAKVSSDFQAVARQADSQKVASDVSAKEKQKLATPRGSGNTLTPIPNAEAKAKAAADFDTQAAAKAKLMKGSR